MAMRRLLNFVPSVFRNHIQHSFYSRGILPNAVPPTSIISNLQSSKSLLEQFRSFTSTAAQFNRLRNVMVGFQKRLNKVRFPNRPSFEIEETPELKKLYYIHFAKPKKPRVRRKSIISGHPQMKGVVLKTLIKKPKKPNSANRKCVLVRLSNGKEKVAYVPGVGHNLQEHNIVLVQGGRTKDVPGLRLKVMRGKYDCGEVIKKKTIPSK